MAAEADEIVGHEIFINMGEETARLLACLKVR